MIILFNFESAKKVKDRRKNGRLFWKSGYQHGLLKACVAGDFAKKELRVDKGIIKKRLRNTHTKK